MKTEKKEPVYDIFHFDEQRAMTIDMKPQWGKIEKQRRGIYRTDINAACKYIRGKHSRRKYPLYRMENILNSIAFADRKFAHAWITRRSAPKRWQKMLDKLRRGFDRAAREIKRDA